MTIAIALNRPNKQGKNEVWLGTDSKISYGTQYARYLGKKMFDCNGSKFAYCGSVTNLQEIKEVAKKVKINKIEDVYKYADKLRELLIEKQKYGTPSNNTSVDHENSIIIATPTNIFQIDCDYSVTEITNHTSIGSGRYLSLGAIDALYDSDLTNEELLERVLKIVCRRNHFCGEPIFIEKVEKVKSGKKKS